MKRLLIYLVIAISLQAGAQTSRTMNPKLQRATVYLSGAHMYYSETVNLLPGYNELIFENISPYINDASLHASSKGGAVMEVKHLLKYKEKIIVTKQYDKEIQNVLDSLEELGYLMKDIENKKSVLATEKNMLLNNRIIKGDPIRDSIPLLKEGMQFLQEKLNAIYEEELKLDRSKNKLTKVKNKLDARYNSLNLLQSGQDQTNNSAAQPIHQVFVALFAETPMAVQLNFSYFVPYANWTPIYDLQASSTTNNFQLKYFANVTQNTGLDWNAVNLTLSTSNPAESNVKPELNTWYLGYLAYDKKRVYEQSNARIPAEAETQYKTLDSKKEDMDDANNLEKYVAVTQNIIRTEYEIKLNYNIAADGKTHKVLINQRELPMLLQFASVPKICTDAFLLARVTGWEDMNIIPGAARITFDGAYVGEMYLNASTTSDTMDINLGRDKTIAITRKKIKDNYKEKIIDDEKVETRTIEIVVRNTKNIPIDIVLEDQIPVVQGTNDIKVKLLKDDGAELDEVTGKLTWNVKLGVKDTRKLVFTYEIRHPKNKPVEGL